MNAFFEIIKIVWAVIITTFVVIILYIAAMWCEQDIETHAKVDAIYNHLGLDTIQPDSINIGRGDTINFNVTFK